MYNASVQVLNNVSGLPETIYFDLAGTQPIASSIVYTDITGAYSFFCNPDTINLNISYQNASKMVVGISIPATISNPVSSVELSSAAQGEGAALVGFYDQYVPAPSGPNYLKTVSDILNGDEVSLFRFINNTAIGAIQAKTSTYDASADIGAAIAALNNAGGGSLYAPEGLYRGQNIRLLPFINFRGCGEFWYPLGANTGTHGRGTVFTTIPGALSSAVTGVKIVGGSGYSGAYTVVFTGGGGSGAAGTVSFVGGIPVWIEITDPGVGYTSAPTVTLSGAAPSVAATLTAVVSATLFYSSASGGIAGADYCSFSGLGFGGLNSAGTPDAGLVLASAKYMRLFKVQSGGFWNEAVKIGAGANGSSSTDIMQSFLTGLLRTTGTPGSLIPSGAVYLEGADSTLTVNQFQAGRSGDSANFPNASLFLGSTATGCRSTANIYQNSDTGMACSGADLQSLNDRFEFNGAHGFWLTRVNPALGAPARGLMTGGKAQSNGAYTNNTFDNFHIDDAMQITGFRGRGLESLGPSSGNLPRYGFYDGEGLANGSGTVPNTVDGYYSDANVGTGIYGGAANYIGPKNSLNIKTNYGSYSTTGTVTHDSNTERMLNTNNTTLASLTWLLPTGIGSAQLPVNDQLAYFTSEGIISALTITAGAGTTINGTPPASMTAGQTIGYQFRTSIWYRIA